MSKEKPQSNEGNLPIDKFLKERPEYGKDLKPGEGEKKNSGAMSEEWLKEIQEKKKTRRDFKV